MPSLTVEFVQYADIPKKGLLRKRLYVGYPLYVIDKMYNVCINELLRRPIDLTDISIPWENTKYALKHFSMYNIIDDVTTIVNNYSAANIHRPIKVHTNINNYLNSIVNRYFNRRYMQYDCNIALKAVEGELCNLYSQLGLEEPTRYFYDMRAVTHEESIIILTEEGKLQQLKAEFKQLYNILKNTIYILQERLIDIPVYDINDTGLDL